MYKWCSKLFYFFVVLFWLNSCVSREWLVHRLSLLNCCKVLFDVSGNLRARFH